jgi:peptidoglycan/LPS O-acetylase OafA/YrhL
MFKHIGHHILATERHECLDGLRGVAALCVFAFHLIELSVPPAQNRLPYAYLAVDFFFLLSGFVIGYAYDAKLSRAPSVNSPSPLTLPSFFRRRLIRLHPMVVAGVILGLIGYLADPFVGQKQHPADAAALGLLILNFALGLFVLPAPSLPNCFGMSHSLDGPMWSLTQEYFANFLYALLGNRAGKFCLSITIFISGILIAWAGWHFSNLALGWGWKSFWAAPLRVLFSFTLGLLIYRRGTRFKKPLPFAISALFLIAAFGVPYGWTRPWHGLYDVLCILMIFPMILIVSIGDTGVGLVTKKVCDFSGRISYPLYMIHYPFVLWFFHWNRSYHPSPQLLFSVAVAVFLATICLAHGFLVFYDEPARRRLSVRFNPNNSSL